jgi:hypothetical protein
VQSVVNICRDGLRDADQPPLGVGDARVAVLAQQAQ